MPFPLPSPACNHLHSQEGTQYTYSWVLNEGIVAAGEVQQALLQLSRGWRFKSEPQGWGYADAPLCNWTGLTCSDNGLPTRMMMQDLISDGVRPTPGDIA